MMARRVFHRLVAIVLRWRAARLSRARAGVVASGDLAAGRLILYKAVRLRLRASAHERKSRGEA